MKKLNQAEAENLAGRLDRIIEKAESLRDIIKADNEITDEDLRAYSQLGIEITGKLDEWRRSLNTYARRDT